jgi:hypothetical protein
MDSRKIYSVHAVTTPATTSRRTVRKHLNADSLLSIVRKDFQKIPDRRADNTKISLDDALMSGAGNVSIKGSFSARLRQAPSGRT